MQAADFRRSPVERKKERNKERKKKRKKLSNVFLFVISVSRSPKCWNRKFERGRREKAAFESNTEVKQQFCFLDRRHRLNFSLQHPTAVSQLPTKKKKKPLACVLATRKLG